MIRAAMLKYTGEPDGQNEDGDGRPKPAGPPMGDRRRRVLGDPKRVRFVVWAVVVCTVLPLMLMPMGALPAQIALMLAIGIALWIVFAVQKEHKRIEERDRAAAIPRCRVCGQGLDVADPEDMAGTRCMECGRVVGRGI